jgi:hypothetical protein
MPRLTILIIVDLAGSLCILASVLTHHFRLPAVIFLSLIAINFLIIKKMRPSAAEIGSIQKRGQAKSASRLRRMGYFYLVALVLGLCFFDYKEAKPWWLVFVGIAISGSFIWLSFRSARKILDIPSEEWERRIGKQ